VMDNRLGGYPKWVLLGENERLMRVPDELQDSVAFVRVESLRACRRLAWRLSSASRLRARRHERNIHLDPSSRSGNGNGSGIQNRVSEDERQARVHCVRQIGHRSMADASRWTDVAILMWGSHMIGRRHGCRLSLLSLHRREHRCRIGAQSRVEDLEMMSQDER
jgi:hypothetical protein